MLTKLLERRVPSRLLGYKIFDDCTRILKKKSVIKRTIERPLLGLRYSRMDQVKFFKGSLP